MLFGRVTDYNTRSNLRASSPPSKNQDPFNLPGFEQLDRLVCIDFLDSLPTNFKHLGISDDGGIDNDLYMAHVVPHAYVLRPYFFWHNANIRCFSDASATITLHNAFLNFSDPNSISTSRCVNATRCILAEYYKLSETSLDHTRLHPFVVVSQIQALSVKFFFYWSFSDLLVFGRSSPNSALQVFYRNRWYRERIYRLGWN